MVIGGVGNGIIFIAGSALAGVLQLCNLPPQLAPQKRVFWCFIGRRLAKSDTWGN